MQNSQYESNMVPSEVLHFYTEVTIKCVARPLRRMQHVTWLFLRIVLSLQALESKQTSPWPLLVDGTSVLRGKWDRYLPSSLKSMQVVTSVMSGEKNLSQQVITHCTNKSNGTHDVTRDTLIWERLQVQSVKIFCRYQCGRKLSGDSDTL